MGHLVASGLRFFDSQLRNLQRYCAENRRIEGPTPIGLLYLEREAMKADVVSEIIKSRS